MASCGRNLLRSHAGCFQQPLEALVFLFSSLLSDGRGMFLGRLSCFSCPPLFAVEWKVQIVSVGDVENQEKDAPV